MTVQRCYDRPRASTLKSGRAMTNRCASSTILVIQIQPRFRRCRGLCRRDSVKEAERVLTRRQL